MAPPRLSPSAAIGTFHSDNSADNLENSELAKMFNERIGTFRQGIRDGATTQPFLGISQDYQAMNQAPVAQMTVSPVRPERPVGTTAPPLSTVPDPSYKYRKVVSTAQAPRERPKAALPDTETIEMTPSGMANDANSPSQSHPSQSHTPQARKRRRRHDIEEEEFESGPGSGESEVEPVNKKAYGRGPKAKEAPPKARATKKPAKKPQKKEANKKSTNKDDFDTQEKKLKELSTFETTSAFRRKAGVNLSAEEKRLVGIDNEGTLSNEDADKSTKTKKRRRPKAADWDAEYPNTTSEVPEDGGLADEELIGIGLDNVYTLKTRWAKAPYVWNKKGLLYNRYKHLAEAKDDKGDYLWPEKVAKAFLGMTREAWKNIQGNSGFFTAKGEPRRRAEKQVIPARTADGKFVHAKDTPEGRQISEATRYQLIYEKLMEPGGTSMKRMRNARKQTEAVIEKALASNIETQKWGREMSKAWHEANKELLDFKEAAVKKIMELEDKTPTPKYVDASTQTELTQEGCDSPQHQAYIQQLCGTSRARSSESFTTSSPSPSPSPPPNVQTFARTSARASTPEIKAETPPAPRETPRPSSNVFFMIDEPMSPTASDAMAGGHEYPQGNCPCNRLCCLGTSDEIDLSATLTPPSDLSVTSATSATSAIPSAGEIATSTNTL